MIRIDVKTIGNLFKIFPSDGDSSAKTGCLSFADDSIHSTAAAYHISPRQARVRQQFQALRVLRLTVASRRANSVRAGQGRPVLQPLWTHPSALPHAGIRNRDAGAMGWSADCDWILRDTLDVHNPFRLGLLYLKRGGCLGVAPEDAGSRASVPDVGLSGHFVDLC